MKIKHNERLSAYLVDEMDSKSSYIIIKCEFIEPTSPLGVGQNEILDRSGHYCYPSSYQTQIWMWIARQIREGTLSLHAPNVSADCRVKRGNKNKNTFLHSKSPWRLKYEPFRQCMNRSKQ